jgi:hypothetical protein
VFVLFLLFDFAVGVVMRYYYDSIAIQLIIVSDNTYELHTQGMSRIATDNAFQKRLYSLQSLYDVVGMYPMPVLIAIGLIGFAAILWCARILWHPDFAPLNVPPAATSHSLREPLP